MAPHMPYLEQPHTAGTILHVSGACMMLITRAATLGTGVVTLIKHSYIVRILVEKIANGELSERVGGGRVQLSSVSAFMFRLPHLARGGEAPGHGTITVS